MTVINMHNDGPRILATNYWSSELAAAGKVWCSVNAGAIRLLLPPARLADLGDMQAAREVILSRGPWGACPEAVELLFDDGSDSPYALHLTPESFDLLPGEPAPDREWQLAVWIEEGGQPHLAWSHLCRWRRVPQIPCLEPWAPWP
jgi:hypothetical protein